MPMTIDEFQKVELRVGRVVSAERVEGSEKLLKLQIDLGDSLPTATEGQGGADTGRTREIRQILSGIGKAYAPEDLLQKEVVLVANRDAREMMGFRSEGMVLAAHGESG